MELNKAQSMALRLHKAHAELCVSIHYDLTEEAHNDLRNLRDDISLLIHKYDPDFTFDTTKEHEMAVRDDY